MKKIIAILMTLISIFSFAAGRDYIAEQKKIDLEIGEDLKSNRYTLEDPFVMVNPYGLSPLTAIVAFDTKESSSVKVTVKGKEKNGDIVHEFRERSRKHIVPIYGLYAGMNRVEIIAGKERALIEIETEELPANMVHLKVEKVERDRADRGMIITAPSINNNMTAYDNSGDIRWFLSERSLGTAGPIKRLSNGNLLVTSEEMKKPPYYVTSVYEIDILGKIHRKLELQGLGHHEFIELPNGNIVGLVDPDGRDTVEDYMIEYDREGKIVKEWDFKKLIKLHDYIAPELYETYNFKGNREAARHDWAHANGFAYDRRDNSFVVSFRHLNALVKFDYKTGEIIWIFADPNNPWLTMELREKLLKVEDRSLYTYGQHAVKVLEDGNILVFDNGNYRDLYSKGITKSSEDYDPSKNGTRALEFKVQDGKISKVWEYSPGDIYTPFIGDVSKIGKNHYYINFGGIVVVDGKPSDDVLGVLVFKTAQGKLSARFTEVKDGKVVFQGETYGLPDSTVYRSGRIELYRKNEREIKF